MKRRGRAFVALIGLLPLLGAAACGTEKYTLSGELGEEGATVRTEATLAMEAGEMLVEWSNDHLLATSSWNSRSVKETTVLEVTDGLPTKARRVVEVDRTTWEYKMIGKEKGVEKDPLEGKTIIMTLADGEWTAKLESGRPTKAQRKALDDWAARRDEKGDESLFPERELEIGEQWTVPRKALVGYAPDSAKNVRSSMTCTLAAIEEHAGEQCAVVDYSLELSFDDNTPEWPKFSVEIAHTGKLYRSLDSHLTLLYEGIGEKSFTGTTATKDGQRVKISEMGPLTFKQTSEIVK